MSHHDIGNQLLFVCGFPSGGTDLARLLLNAHPDIYINGEMPFLIKLKNFGCCHNSIKSFEDFLKLKQRLYDLDNWNNIENLEITKDEFALLQKEVGDVKLVQLLSLFFSNKNKLIWGNKTPQYTENLDSIFSLFPHAKIIIIVRDVRDVCLSWNKKWGKDILWCAHKWTKRMQKGWVTANQPEFVEKCLFVKFEDMLSNTFQTSIRICNFLNINFSERMLNHHEYVTAQNMGKIN